MVSLSDYLEGSGQKLNYWGFRYAHHRHLPTFFFKFDTVAAMAR